MKASRYGGDVVEDRKIVDLFWERSEDAIRETDAKYGKYCYSIAYNILRSNEDSEECVNDTYIKAWDSIPPSRPNKLSLFLGKITRNIALNRFDYNHAQKRNSDMADVFDEASEILSYSPTSSAYCESGENDLREAINSFVASLPKETRVIFVRRYWHLCSIKDIASDCGLPEGTVKSILSRVRKRFAEYLKKEDIII